MGLLDQTANVIVRDQFSGTLGNLHRQQQQAGAGFDQMGSKAGSAGGALSGLSGIAGALGVTLGAAGVIKAGQAAVQLGNLGAQAIVTRDSFASVTESVGRSTALLDQMKAAAGGTIDEVRLMQLANTALAGASGETGAAFADLIPRLIEGARAANKLNPALGDTEFLFQSLVTGIKRGSPLLIDNTGITLSIAEANEKLAASLGKSVEQLTEEEKQMALMGETARGVDRILAQSGGSLDTMAVSADKLSTSFTNLKTAIGEALAPTTSELQSGLALSLQGLTAYIRDDQIAEHTNRLQLAQKQLADYSGWVGTTASAEAFRVASVQNATRAIEEETEAIARLKAASDANIFTKQEEEARRLVGVSTDLSYLMTQQEREARRLAGGMDVVATATNRVAVSIARVTNLAPPLEAAFGRLRSLATAFADAENSLQSTLIGAVDVLSFDQYAALLDAAATYQKGLRVQVALGVIDQERADYLLAQYRNNLQGGINDLREFTKATDDAGASTSDLASEIAGMIDAELAPSFSLADLAPELATTEGNIDEHYRRLAAIALRGGEEIAAHQQDWADTLAKIPEDKRAQGIEAMQQWAIEQLQAYDQGIINSDLIDKNAIKDRILAQLRANETRDAVIAEIAASLGNVSLSDIQAAAGDAGLGVGLGATVSVGIQDSVDVDAMLRTTAAAITSGAQDKFAKQLRESGNAVGSVVLSGITQAVTEGAGDIINLLAAAITPSVLAAVEQRNRRAGGAPPP